MIAIERSLNSNLENRVSLEELAYFLRQVFSDEQKILKVLAILNQADTNQLYQKFISDIQEIVSSSEADDRTKLAYIKDPNRLALAMIKIILDDYYRLITNSVPDWSSEDLFNNPTGKLIALQGDILTALVQGFGEQVQADRENREEKEKALCLIPIFLELKPQAKPHSDCPYRKIRNILYKLFHTLLNTGPTISESTLQQHATTLAKSLTSLLESEMSKTLPSCIVEYVRSASKHASLMVSVLHQIAHGPTPQ